MSFLRLATTHARIAVRTVPLWVAVVPLTGFALVLALVSPAAPRDGAGAGAQLAFTGQVIALFTGVAYAAAFSGLLTTPGRLGLQSLEASTPVRPVVLQAARLVGTLAVVAPSVVALEMRGVWLVTRGQPMAWLVALGVAVAIVLPSALLAMAISALAGALLVRGVSRMVAVLGWFWVGFSTPLIPLPTLNGTVLNLVGDYVAAGLFDGRTIYRPVGSLGLAPTPGLALASLGFQLGLALVLIAAGTWLAQTKYQR